MKPMDMELLDEFYSAGHMRCKFGQQLIDWGPETLNTVMRARRGGIPVEVIHDVLAERHPDVSCTITIRAHFNGSCKCPKRR